MITLKNDYDELKRSFLSFSVLSIGLFYLILQFSILFFHPYSPSGDPFLYFQLTTLLTTLAIMFSGIYLYKTDLRNLNLLKIAGWVSFGLLFGLTVTLLNILFQQYYNSPLVFKNVMILNNSSLGGFVGLIIGFYHANSSERAYKMKEEKRENELLQSLLTHDLRNKLQVLEGELHLLKEKEELTTPQEDVIDKSLMVGEKIMDISNKIRKAMKTTTKSRLMKKSEITRIIRNEVEKKRKKQMILTSPLKTMAPKKRFYQEP